MNKRNCWEFMKCGRQMSGHQAHQGVCPTATAVKLNGVHGGLLGGRACWVVQGTKCNGELQGSFSDKYKSCQRCAFYKAVMAEEGTKFILSPILLERLKFGKAAVQPKQFDRDREKTPFTG
ncbi:MAG: hypothetical protein OEW15_04110 [Nitrospirota bacterium]|nr:hypothetical protein [Nitrospirota bacterium]